ncbi:MAG: hypothetical protein HKN32_10385, partial [Flavobacteriales bacterium]|nr:hypothetical protein [Flavobacteriales bacterium]
IQDYTTGEIFALFKREGWHVIKQVETDSGETLGSFKLLHRYTDNLRINDGWAYYTYRPFESSQKKFLYKEQINLTPAVTKNLN